MKMPWESTIEGLTDLAGEWIEDKDKQNEFNFRVKELSFKLRETLLTTKTTPKTDAFVKILIAFRDIIMPLLRPLGAAGMTAFALYCQYKGIELTGATEAVLVGAFPAWGASRHAHKKEELKNERYVSSGDSGWEEGFD